MSDRTEDVGVVSLIHDNQICAWDNIEAALEEIQLFWSEDGPEMEVQLLVSFSIMPKTDFDALPEFAGW